MGFEIEVFQRLEAIERALRSLESSVIRPGPFVDITPRPGIPQANPMSLATLRGLLADLGQYAPGDSLLAQWLVRYTPQQINDAIRRLLGPMPGSTAEEDAYYLSVKSHANGGWKNVFPELAGEDAGPIVSPDKLSNLLVGISNANGPDDLKHIVPEVIRRANLGIDWAGQIRLSVDELEEVSRRLSMPRKEEWLGWRDERLLSILLRTNGLPLDAPLFGDYPDVSDLKNKSVAEWLYDQKLAL